MQARMKMRLSSARSQKPGRWIYRRQHRHPQARVETFEHNEVMLWVLRYGFE